MNIIKSVRFSLTWLGFSLALLGSAQAMAANGAHEVAYAAALQRLQVAPDRLLTEMRRIDAGEVAHFDFLQHEHIELLRDSKALAFPPTSLPQDKREALSTQAGAVLRLATDLEWTLADFLRGQAAVNAAVSSTADIVRQASNDAEPATRSALNTLGQKAIAFRQTGDDSTLQALFEAYDDVAGLSLHPQYLDELSAQKNLIRNNVAGIERGLTELRTTQLRPASKHLVELYGEEG